MLLNKILYYYVYIGILYNMHSNIIILWYFTISYMVVLFCFAVFLFFFVFLLVSVLYLCKCLMGEMVVFLNIDAYMTSKPVRIRGRLSSVNSPTNGSQAVRQVLTVII